MARRQGILWLCIAFSAGACPVVSGADLAPEAPDDALFAQRALTSALIRTLAKLPLAGKQVGIAPMPHGGGVPAPDPLVRQSLLQALLANKAAVCSEEGRTTCWQVRYEVLHLHINCIRSGSRLFGTARLERRFQANLAVEVITDSSQVIWSTVPVSAVSEDRIPSHIADRCESPLIDRVYVKRPRYLLEAAAVSALLAALAYAIL